MRGEGSKRKAQMRDRYGSSKRDIKGVRGVRGVKGVGKVKVAGKALRESL